MQSLTGIFFALLLPMGAFSIVRCFERTGHRGIMMVPAYVGFVSAVVSSMAFLVLPFFVAKVPVNTVLNMGWWTMMISIIAVVSSVGSGLWLGLKQWPIEDRSAP